MNAKGIIVDSSTLHEEIMCILNNILPGCEDKTRVLICLGTTRCPDTGQRGETADSISHNICVDSASGSDTWGLVVELPVVRTRDSSEGRAERKQL